MNKKALTLTISLCAALGLCAAAVMVSANTKGPEDSVAEDISAHVIDGDITEIKYQNAGSDEISLVLNDEKWTLSENTAFPLIQSYAETMRNYCSDITATRYLGESDEFEQYGLNSPSLKISLSANGESTNYLIGDKNTHTGDYYFAVEGKNSVYTVSYSLINAFEKTPEQMAEIRQPPSFTANEIDSVELVQNGESFKLFGKTIEVDENTSESLGESSSLSQSQADEAQRKYTFIKNNIEKELDTDKAEGFLNSLNSISFSECAAFMPPTLGEYSLDVPGAKIILNYTKPAQGEEAAPASASYTLLIGGGSADGKRYISLDGTDMVCTTDADIISDILTVNFE